MLAPILAAVLAAAPAPALGSTAAPAATRSPEPDSDSIPMPAAPAAQAAIVAGGKACIGATVDGARQDARLAGWIDTTPTVAPPEPGGRPRVVQRENVMLVVKPGAEGGCVVTAMADAAFDRARFLADLGRVAGTAIITEHDQPITRLANGELMITQIGMSKGKQVVVLVIANAAQARYGVKKEN